MSSLATRAWTAVSAPFQRRRVVGLDHSNPIHGSSRGAPINTDNAPRYRPGSGHVESFFLRANHPTEPRAFWLKATILAPNPGAGEPVAELWCVVFDDTTRRDTTARETVPLTMAAFDRTGRTIQVAGAHFSLDPVGGELRGRLAKNGHAFSWDLRTRTVDGPLGDPLCLFPLRRMVDGGFPRSKLLTPAPSMILRGHMTVDGTVFDVDGWPGMQGHNWGSAHAPEYVWGQCLFHDVQGAPFAMVEAFTGRTRLGPVLSPRISALVVRRGGRELRFDRLVDLWRQEATVDDLTWSLTMRGADGEARLVMRADPEHMACLGYKNPDGALSYCLNSKLAHTVLRVNPANDEGFECVSPHGGALEFLSPTADPRFPEVV